MGKKKSGKKKKSSGKKKGSGSVSPGTRTPFSCLDLRMAGCWYTIVSASTIAASRTHFKYFTVRAGVLCRAPEFSGQQ